MPGLARSRLLRLALAGLALLIVWSASLAWPSPASAERPMIPPGREAELLALFAPYELGGELAPGWTLHSMDIEQSRVIVWVEGPEQVHAKLTLDHPDYGPRGSEPLPSFAWTVAQAPPGSELAISSLRERIAANDDGSFWGATAVSNSVVVEDQRARRALAWLRDGLVLFVAFAAVLGVMLYDKLRDAEPWMRWSLAAIVLVGVLLRLSLPIRVAMAPWAYTRILVTAQLVYAGPMLTWLHPGPVYLSDVIHLSNLVLAMLAPLALYVHASYLLADRRAALLVAGVVAILPLHLRFSYSDAAFISSITVSSLTFAMTHAAVREQRAGRLPRAWMLVLLLLPVPLALTYLVRPLNLMYLPLLIATAFVDEGLHEDKPKPSRGRLAVVVAVILALTIAVAIPHLRSNHASDVSSGLSFETLREAAGVLLSPRLNALLNPRLTPPGLLLLAGYGAWDLARRRRFRLLVFLLAWLLGFLVAHAYVVPVEPLMQARYHLHLIVPFMLLAVAGIDAGLRWLDARSLSDARRRALIAAGAAYLLASPVIHLGFIRDVAFNEMREWQFVHGLREQIEPGCVVLEHTGMGTDSRAERVGAYFEAGMPRQRFTHISLAADDEGQDLSEQALAALNDPPACLYVLQSLPCYSAKRDDEPIAPVCHGALGWLPHEEVARVEFDSRIYDENLGAHLGEFKWIELVLYRLDTQRL